MEGAVGNKSTRGTCSLEKFNIVVSIAISLNQCICMHNTAEDQHTYTAWGTYT